MSLNARVLALARVLAAGGPCPACGDRPVVIREVPPGYTPPFPLLPPAICPVCGSPERIILRLVPGAADDS